MAGSRRTALPGSCSLSCRGPLAASLRLPTPSVVADVFARFARASQNFSKKVLAFGWIIPYIKSSQADMAQLVEHNLAKVGVAGSSPVVRSIWAFSSGGERFPDTEEVRSSNLLTPTKCSQLRGYVLWAVLFWLPNVSPNTLPNFEFLDLSGCFSVVIRGNSRLLRLHVHIFQGFMPRLHEARQGTTATCWSSIIFWNLLA